VPIEAERRVVDQVLGKLLELVRLKQGFSRVRSQKMGFGSEKSVGYEGSRMNNGGWLKEFRVSRVECVRKCTSMVRGMSVMAKMLDRVDLQGLIPPLVSPVNFDGGLDLEGTRRLVDHVIDGGAAGLFVLGTCGEGVALSYRKRYQFVEAVCEASAGRLPVLVSVSDTSLEEALDLATHSFASGASAVVSTGPYFLPVPSGHMETYFHRLADESPLPLVLYNMPGCTKFSIPPAVVGRLAKHPKVLGIKDSSGDLNYVRELIAAVAGQSFPVMIGPEELLLPAMELGAVGGVNGGGLLFPQVYVARIEAFRRGDFDLAKKADEFVQTLSRQLYSAPSGRMAVIEALKLGLSLLGICQPWVLSPLLPLDEEHRQRINRSIPELELMAYHLCPTTKLHTSSV
jgi:4-hydroxy-tetrahydrodipicolinate synthase